MKNVYKDALTSESLINFRIQQGHSKFSHTQPKARLTQQKIRKLVRGVAVISSFGCALQEVNWCSICTHNKCYTINKVTRRASNYTQQAHLKTFKV